MNSASRLLLPVVLASMFACSSAESTSPQETQSTAGGETPAETPTPAEEATPVVADSGPACTSSGFMSYEASASAYANRHGLNAARFSELTTSPEKPLEECSLNAILERLVTLQCDDGSNPFQGNRSAAHSSRAGSIGPGGRCGAILDVYDVPCPEGSYAVHADMYFCPAGRSAM